MSVRALRGGLRHDFRSSRGGEVHIMEIVTAMMIVMAAIEAVITGEAQPQNTSENVEPLRVLGQDALRVLKEKPLDRSEAFLYGNSTLVKLLSLQKVVELDENLSRILPLSVSYNLYISNGSHILPLIENGVRTWYSQDREVRNHPGGYTSILYHDNKTVEVLAPNGTWRYIYKYDQSQERYQSVVIYHLTPAGWQFYDEREYKDLPITHLIPQVQGYVHSDSVLARTYVHLKSNPYPLAGSIIEVDLMVWYEVRSR